VPVGVRRVLVRSSYSVALVEMNQYVDQYKKKMLRKLDQERASIEILLVLQCRNG